MLKVLNDTKTRVEADSIFEKVRNFKFVLGVVFLFKIFSHLSSFFPRMFLQNSTMELLESLNRIEITRVFFKITELAKCFWKLCKRQSI